MKRERIQRARAETPEPEVVEDAPSRGAHAADLVSDLDELLEEIDEVLEENAEEFVTSYVQKGGE